jgi:hypothetical protein
LELKNKQSLITRTPVCAKTAISKLIKRLPLVCKKLPTERHEKTALLARRKKNLTCPVQDLKESDGMMHEQPL